MKHNLSIASALALSLLVSPACKKDKKEGGDKAETSQKTGDKGGDKAGDKGGDKAGDKGSSPGAAASADMMSHFPKDTEIVVAFNIGSLTGTSMWKQYGKAAMANVAKELGEFEATCGFNPITTINTVHLGVNSAKNEEPVLIVNGFAREQLTKCAKAMAEKEGEKIELTEDGKFTMVVKDDKKTAIGWIDDKTMIMIPDQGDKEYLTARIEGKDGLKGSAGFETAAGKAKQGAPIWFAGYFADGSPAASGMGAMGAAPKGFYGSIGFSTGVDFDLGVTFADAKSAEETLNMAKPMLGMAKGQLGPAGSLVDKLELATKGEDLTVGLTLTDADIETLKGLAGPMLGGMGGL